MRMMRTGQFLVLAVLYVFCACDTYAGIIYVSATDGNDANDGSSWLLAKQTIQAGVDAAASNDTVLVTNGIYNAGGRIPPGQVLCQTRVVIDKSVRVLSVNGPSNTFIVGQGPRNETAIRCVWMTSNTVLTGFTLTNGYTVVGVGGREENGGGLLASWVYYADHNSPIVSNCIITTCQASDGGGAYRGTLNNCTLTGNSASYDGGGAEYGTLDNCTAYGNTNGGLYGGTARNTISFGNTGYEMTNVTSAFCFTNNPRFMDAAGGNLRLQPTSLCIDAGWNAFAPTNTPCDLDSQPRIFNGRVDMGAYEYQGVAFLDLFASAGPHGIINPTGLIRTNQGADVAFVIQPDAYYHVHNVLTNGGSAGTATNFTWYNLSGTGTVTVSFAATLAVKGTPHWWLAQWGWTNDFDTVEALDQDEDGLFTWEEYLHNTCPTNANTDGDQYDDGVEVNAGANPLQDDSQTYGAMQAHPASFNLYTSNSVLDLSYGEMMVQVVSNNIQVRLTMQSTDLLDGGSWTNVGPDVEWQCPADLNKSFFRFLGAPTD